MTLHSRHAAVQQAIQLTLNQLGDNRTQLVQDILTRVVIECLKKFQEKLNIGVQDSVADLLDTFKQKITNQIFYTAQTWVLSTKREKTLFPQACRFLYTKGKSTVVVIEDKPACRTLSLDRNLLGDPVGSNSHVFDRVILALPYTVFVLHFVNDYANGSGQDRFVGLYLAWRKSPLQSLNDMLCNPIMPNIHLGLNVCMGHDYSPQGETLSAMADDVIAQFWNSSFNNDLSQYWWAKARVHDNFSTVRSWVAASAEDPLFVLNVDYVQEFTLDRVLNACVDSQQECWPDASAMRHHLSETIDKCSEQMFMKVLKYFRKTKFERYYPSDIVDNVNKAIAPIAEQLTGIVMAIEMEFNKLAEDIRKTEMNDKHYGWEPRGTTWNKGTHDELV